MAELPERPEAAAPGSPALPGQQPAMSRGAAPEASSGALRCEGAPVSLIEYPSAFPIKVMGLYAEGFESAVVAVARQFDPAFDIASVERRPSKAGKYLGLTVTVTATSREQLDELYRALSVHPLVKVVL